jgi:hypothetical protein
VIGPFQFDPILFKLLYPFAPVVYVGQPFPNRRCFLIQF